MSLEIAREWHEEPERELGKPRINRMVYSNSKNELGITVRQRTTKWMGAADKNGNPLPNCALVYAVTWSLDPGLRKMTSFSVDKYLEKKARKKGKGDLRRHNQPNCHSLETGRGSRGDLSSLITHHSSRITFPSTPSPVFERESPSCAAPRKTPERAHR